MPEFINLKVKYGQNIQVAGSVGFFYMPWGNPWNWSTTAEIIFHFAGESKYVEQPPWYLLFGLTYYEGFDMGFFGDYGEYDFGFFPRIGKTFNFSKRSGVNIDIGVNLPLSARPGDPPNPPPDYEFRILPSASIGLFIRL